MRLMGSSHLYQYLDHSGTGKRRTKLYLSRLMRGTNSSCIFTGTPQKDCEGLCLWAIDDQIACAHQGRTLGEYNNQWGRLMLFGIYNSYGPGSGSIVRHEAWDFPKNGSVLQDLARKMLAW
jgi:hypothetical protein